MGKGFSFGTELGQDILNLLRTEVGEAILAGVTFIVDNYNLGDKLYFFGGQSGALIAKMCADLLLDVGILRPHAMDSFTWLYRAYLASEERRLPFTQSEEWNMLQMLLKDGEMRSMKCDKPTVEVLGAFDTLVFQVCPSRTELPCTELRSC
jgi:uncharacterized protein (DUF2235 family)